MITPNRITVARLLLTAVGVWLLCVNDTFTARASAFCILFIAAWSDAVDGWLARFMERVTDIGKILDPVADKVLILGVMAGMSYNGIYSYIWVVLIAFREIAVTIVRIFYLKKGKVLAAESLGKIKTISQNISLLVSFLYLFMLKDFSDLKYWPDFVTNIFFYANYLFLIIAFLLTYISGISFFRNLRRSHEAA
jgi:CDP-diacylglycerol--glycerol-3-phosphate 3-phosphatidyltransferase